MICRLDRLRTTHSKRQKSHMRIERLSTYTFRLHTAQGNPGLTNWEDLDVTLCTVMQHIT